MIDASTRRTIARGLLIVLVLCTLSIEGFQLTPRGIQSFQRTGKNDLSRLHMSTSEESNNGQALIGVAGIVANVVTDYSLYVLKTTGCGLPPGPFGLLGAAEGVSYLGVVGILVWSIITKVKTGKGLPAGPSGLLGAGEGLTFLTVLGGLVVAVLNLQQYGYLPGFLPDGNCYGVQ